MDLSKFLATSKYIDYSSKIIAEKADILFSGLHTDVEKVAAAYEYVRDNIPHSFDINATMITAKASDVLLYKTGICHAKSNLLAALLRLIGIPTGFCFQHITLWNDDSLGYCVHCFNAVFLDNHWIKLDARGNKSGIDAQFSLTDPVLAFPIRKEYDEYYWNGIYASPHSDTMHILESAKSIQDVIDNIPDFVSELPDIADSNLRGM